MNIKKVVKLAFIIIIVLILATFLLNAIILKKLEENNQSRKKISKLVLMQENMNILVKDATTADNKKELESIKLEFIKYEKMFEDLKNTLIVNDMDDFLDFFIKDIHKSQKILDHLELLSESEEEIEESFDKIYNLQLEQIELKYLFLENYPKENILRRTLEEDIVKTKISL